MSNLLDTIADKGPVFLTNIWGDYGIWIATTVVACLLAERIIKAWRGRG